MSGIATVHVAQVVSAKLADGSVAKNRTVTVTGIVSPKENGQKVVLQVRSHGHWVGHGSALVHGATYDLHTSLASLGSRSLRIGRSATTKNTVGIS